MLFAARRLSRNLEVWKFLASCGLKVLKAGKTKGGDEAVSAAKTAAAIFIRDGLFRLGPTFVKFGQVISTRTDVLDKEYIDVLKDLQDNVPGFGGDRAVAIIEKELGKPINEVFETFDREPIAAASLGQVHTATYKGQKVAVKVQRAGLKELFDTDLKNLKAPPPAIAPHPPPPPTLCRLQPRASTLARNAPCTASCPVSTAFTAPSAAPHPTPHAAPGARQAA